MSLDNEIVTKMDKALEADPRRIRWMSNGKGVQGAVATKDPHTERPWRRDPDRPLPPENFDGCTCPSNCNLHEESTDDD